MRQNHKKIKLRHNWDLLSTKPTRLASKTISGHVPKPTHEQDNHKANKHNISSQWKQGEDGRVLPRELLDNGQGKSTKNSNDNRKGGSNINISTEDSTDQAVPLTDRTDTDIGGNNSLLHPPIIEAMCKIATGATTSQLPKQNRLHHQEMLLQQPVSSQW